jgi:hypothetical protein
MRSRRASLTQDIDLPAGQTSEAPVERRRAAIAVRWVWQVLRVMGIVAVVWLYVSAAVRQSEQVNTEMGRTDQSAYMGYARHLAESHYTYVGNRNRMPLYPLIQSLHYQSGQADELFFARGKAVNIALSVAFLAGISLVLRSILPSPAPAVLSLTAAFMVFAFKAGYFQAELLFYFLSFVAFVLMNRMLIRPTWKTALLTGLALGLAHLTKASVLPALLLFVTVALLRESSAVWQKMRRAACPGSMSARQAIIRLACAGLAALSFLLTVSHYIWNSKRVYGQYFYNVNSTFYVWYDSWEEAKEGTRAHGDREGWPAMPAESIPSPGKYLEEHSWQEIGDRLRSGVVVVVTNAVESYGYHKYALALLAFCILVAAANPRRTCSLLRDYGWSLLFNALYFCGYLVLYAWFTPICVGTRLPLAQFLPLALVCSYVPLRLYRDELEIPCRGRKRNLGRLFYAAMSVILAVDIYHVCTQGIVSIYGGN